MKNILFINPLKPGKLEGYKAFMAEFLGPRREEYINLLKRYGLKTTRVYYHNLAGTEFVVVDHDIEDDAHERLQGWPTSTHPFDVWFKEQLQKFHDFELAKSAGPPQLLLAFNPDV